MRITLAILFLFFVSTANADMVYSGNGASGFGGAIGNGDVTLNDDGTTVTSVFNRGGGDFNDILVLYIDAGAGGFSNTSTFTDTGDDSRRAVSGLDGTNRALVTFASNFDADYAVSYNNNFVSLWSLKGGEPHTFLSGSALSGINNDPSYSFSFNFSQIGLTSADSFDFVGTYVAQSAFRSDEVITQGVTTGIGSNPGHNPIVFSGLNTYVGSTAVPEPSAFLTFGIAIAAFRCRRRRRS